MRGVLVSQIMGSADNGAGSRTGKNGFDFTIQLTACRQMCASNKSGSKLFEFEADGSIGVKSRPIKGQADNSQNFLAAGE